jgi:putative hydrolase of HD superfamily
MRHFLLETGGKVMIRKALLLKVFDAAYMQRWNDKIRPVEFTELDKQAHKMIIAYFLGKFQEHEEDFNWIDLIEWGFFELLQRIVVTDLKPPIFYKIKADRDKYRKLNEWVFRQLDPVLSPLGESFRRRFQASFDNTRVTLTRRVLDCAHILATKWEFDILERANPNGYEIEEIRLRLEEKQDEYCQLTGMQQLRENQHYRNFIDLCGQLRFQARWAHIHRIPRTSVLGHLLIVAVFTYLFSLELKACPRRCVNNYFTGLFHDLPEVLTRDIISPVKSSVEGLRELIKDYEKEMMEKEVYGLIPSAWHSDIRLFTENEFQSMVQIDGQLKEASSLEINSLYNEDRFEPRDGDIVRAADCLAAFIEAYIATRNGSASPDLHEAKLSIKSEYEKANIAGINFGEIYADFD